MAGRGAVQPHRAHARTLPPPARAHPAQPRRGGALHGHGGHGNPPRGACRHDAKPAARGPCRHDAHPAHARPVAAVGHHRGRTAHGAPRACAVLAAAPPRLDGRRRGCCAPGAGRTGGTKTPPRPGHTKEAPHHPSVRGLRRGPALGSGVAALGWAPHPRPRCTDGLRVDIGASPHVRAPHLTGGGREVRRARGHVPPKRPVRDAQQRSKGALIDEFRREGQGRLCAHVAMIFPRIDNGSVRAWRCQRWPLF